MIKLASILLALCLPLSAQNYSVTPAGAGCGGAKLNGYLTDLGNHKELHFDCTGLFPSEFGFVCWGTTKISFKLPDNCWVWTNFTYGHTFRSDATGKWEGSHAWPLSIYADFYIQVATYRTVDNVFQLKTTDAIHCVHMN